MQIAYLDGPRLRRSLLAACDYARRQRSELNRINVFPVPDGDTGTNLALTVQAITDRLRSNRDRDLSAVAHAAAQAAVLGARGNCGMMLSHFLLGFAERVGDLARVSAREFGEALKAGADNLHAALERPAEGTILTVVRDTAQAAERAATRDFVPLLAHLVERARASLARTPDLLPVLKRAGVVDAGAKAFVALLEGVLLFIHGDPFVPLDAEDGGRVAVADIEYEGPTEHYRFCTEALARGAELPDQEEARSVLGELGDSLIVIRMDDVLKVHVHTDRPEAVFDYLRGAGTLVTHKAEDMRVQHEAIGRAAGEGHVSLARRPITIVTDSAADLPDEVARAHGIRVTPLVLVAGDRTYRDGVDITAEQFHRRLAEDPETLPTTSQPAPADFLETWARAAEDGEEVLGVMLGSSLSGTFASAEAAARSFHGAPLHLVDSLGLSLLQGLLTLRAAELAELGTPPADIVAALERIRTHSGLLFTVDTFERLLASGRVGRGRALLGSVLNVKPVLGLSAQGHIEPVDMAIGRRRVRALLMEELARRLPADNGRVRFGIVHVGVPEIVPSLSAELVERFGEVEVLASPATPVIATHLGTGAWGVAYMVED